MSKRVVELGEDLIDSLNLRNNIGPDEIVLFSGRFQTWALDDEAIGVLRGACVDERTIRLFAEVEVGDE